jgi:hypothetical protein
MKLPKMNGSIITPGNNKSELAHLLGKRDHDRWTAIAT